MARCRLSTWQSFFEKINPILLGSSSLSFEIHLEDMQPKGWCNNILTQNW